MIALILAAVWLAASVGVGLLIGRAIRIGDQQLADTTPETVELYVPREWVA